MIKNFILFLGLSISLFVIVLLLRKPKKKVSDYLLIVWFSASFFHLGFFFLGFNYLLADNYLLIAFGNTLPALHIFVNSIYINVLRSKSIFPLAYIYGFVLLAYVGAYYYMGSSGSTVQNGMLLSYSSNAARWTYFVPPSFLLVYLVTGAYILRAIRIYRFNFKAIYSNNIHSNITWLGYWFWSYMVGSIIIVSIILSTDFGLVSVHMAYIIVSAVLSLQIFFLGQLGVTNNFTFDQVSDKHVKYAASGLKENRKEILKQQLLDYLQSSKAYLNPNLSLQDLALGIKLPAYQISQLINESLQTSFYDLINTYRVSEFKNRINNPQYKHMSILGIALDCGFNSKSGFYKSFKKHTGMSPSAFKKISF